MENRNKVTEKLLKIVQNRKTKIVINKQESGYKRNRKMSGNLAHDSYSNKFDE